MNITKILNTRYSTKAFKSDQKIPTATWEHIENALQLSPSSTNAQPWHFIIASTEEGKKRLTKGTKDKFDFNTPKVLTASHAVLFCTKTDLSEEYLQHVLAIEDHDGRYPDQDFKGMMHQGRSMFVNFHKNDFNDLTHWNEKQVYLNVGNSLLAAATLGVDALPMEGIDVNALNQEFNLTEKGLTASVLVVFGFHAEDDFNKNLPKSRLPKTEIFTHI